MKAADNPTSEISDLIEDPQTYNESISSSATTTTSSKSLQKQMSRASLQQHHPAFP